jgi:hypothetical protein
MFQILCNVLANIFFSTALPQLLYIIIVFQSLKCVEVELALFTLTIVNFKSSVSALFFTNYSPANGTSPAAVHITKVHSFLANVI